MISGVHVVVYSKNAELDRALIRDIIGFDSVDAGGGWLIFAMPPGEVAFHPADENDQHRLYFMCDDLPAEMASLMKKGITCTPSEEMPWGTLSKIPLPGGGTIGLYQPKHPTAIRLKR